MENPILSGSTFKSPYVARILTMWENYRKVVISNFPEAPGLPINITDYKAHIAGIYTQDAYNSLSIEGYKVSKGLIEKV